MKYINCKFLFILLLLVSKIRDEQYFMEHTTFESAMAASRKLWKNKNYFNYNSINGLFLIVYTLALMSPSHSTTIETEDEIMSDKIKCSISIWCNRCTIKPMCVWSLERQACEYKNQFNSSSLIASRIGECPHAWDLFIPSQKSKLDTESNKIMCSDSLSCTKCTINSMCVWSLEQQKCENKNQFNLSSLIVSTMEECPQFSVVKKYNYNDDDYIHVEYTVEITNDLVGFISYLNNSTISFEINAVLSYSPHHNYDKAKIINETIILCSFSLEKIWINNSYENTYYMFIRFNDIILRFDNVADHYVTFYEHKECPTDEIDKQCAICGWSKLGYSNYLKWCSSESTCEGSKNVYIKQNRRFNYENVAYVTNDCAEINVTAVNPLSGPETGGTTITITVKNHRILADHRKVEVTLAGTVCTNPKTSGLETITCTTSQSIGTPSGPAVVEYSSIDSLLMIESSQTFRFCSNPVLDVDQQLGGEASGGISVPVRGRHFVKSCFKFLARLYVDLADGARQYADSYCDPPVNDTYMLCRSPRVNCTDCSDGEASVVGRRLNFGLMVMKFTENQLLHINGTPLSFYVHPDPILEDFVMDESGSVVINGLNLQNIQLDKIVVRSLDSPSKVCVVVSLTRHSLLCKPTMSIIALQKISVTLGNLLVFTVIKRTLTHPTHHDDPFILPGWFFSTMSITVLVLVCAFACYLKRKTRYNVIITRLQDL